MLTAETGVIAAAAAIVFSAALVSSIAGFAFAALAGGALVLLLADPVRAVGILVTCSIAIQSHGVWALRGSIRWRQLWPFAAGGALTVPLGVWLLAHTPPQVFAPALGIFLTLYGLYLLVRGTPPLVRATRGRDALVGAAGGLAGGLAGFPGAITLWCGMRGWPKEEQRALFQPYILLMQLEALVCLRAQAPAAISAEALFLYAPLALLASFAGMALYRGMTTRQFNATVHLLLIASGVSLLGVLQGG